MALMGRTTVLYHVRFCSVGRWALVGADEVVQSLSKKNPLPSF